MKTIPTLPASRLSILLLGLVLSLSTVYAQPTGTQTNSVHRFSTSLGGLSDFKQGAFLFGELGFGLSRHLSLAVTLHRDDTRENWSDGSKGYYYLYAPTVGLRLSQHANGRGLFAQGGVGYALANLRVTEADGRVKTDAGNAPIANWKLGYRWSPRWGRKPTGLFIEGLLNYSVAWQDLVLQTSPAPTGSPARRPTLDYHSWNNYAGKVGQTFLIGIGYTW
ncbi:hypothetical protein DYU11_03665 [Fibrisoma montanum]|uniref:Outer membrane protein beta-barrel domain-containing protein n=1 Tax=Fibrisoma montanum TaxID=2305895 RepID=A0A418MJ22_9BACT|nr:hypothetical protein [Fibrisoma montanum]RIV27414.1 hypothetical protein DYU11_03665 [Fibrisoma montanum]